MGMKLPTTHLTRAEESFLQALLWEEGRLVNGPATQAAKQHGLTLVRCLEVVNRLVPDFQGEALNRIRAGSCPDAEWPWHKLNGDEVLRLLWERLTESPDKSSLHDDASPASGRGATA
jgi:hypothetical protein